MSTCPYMDRDVELRRFHSYKSDPTESPRRKCRLRLSNTGLSRQPTPLKHPHPCYKHFTLSLQHEGLQHRLSTPEEDHTEGVWKLSDCGLQTVFLVLQLQYQRLRQCQLEFSGGPEVPRRSGASTVCHPGRDSAVSAPRGQHLRGRGSG